MIRNTKYEKNRYTHSGLNLAFSFDFELIIYLFFFYLFIFIFYLLSFIFYFLFFITYFLFLFFLLGIAVPPSVYKRHVESVLVGNVRTAVSSLS